MAETTPQPVSTTPKATEVSEIAEAVSSGKSVPSQKVKIQVSGTGGGFSFDEFNRAIGKDVDAVDEQDEPEVEEGAGELLEKEDPEEETEPKEDEAAEDSEDEEEQEEAKDEADLDEISKEAKKGAVKAFTKDGKSVSLPPDLEIVQNIDGEERRINLREHLNVVAGELTVQSRLGKIGSFREQVEKRRQEIEAVHTNFHNDIQTLVSFAKEGKPDLAICYLAEINGMSPIEMKKQFLKALVAEATKFEGKSEVEIENYYLNLDRKWRERKEQKQREQSDKQSKAQSFVQHVTEELKKENISPDEFTVATNQLRDSGELQGLSNEAAVDRVIEHALYSKHVNMAKSAIGLVDPALVNNKKLFDLLLEHTHPNKFTVEEMAAVVSEYLGEAKTRIASSLSKKVRVPQVQAKSEKQNEAGKKQKTYRSQSDLAKAFGL